MFDMEIATGRVIGWIDGDDDGYGAIIGHDDEGESDPLLDEHYPVSVNPDKGYFNELEAFRKCKEAIRDAVRDGRVEKWLATGESC